MGRWRFALVLVTVLLLAVLVVGAPAGGEDEPLDPRSTGESGARGLVVLLEELGADVDLERGVPADTAEAAVLLEDQLDDERRLEVREWVDRGGTLVVADPSSGLAPPVVAEDLLSALSATPVLEREECDIDALDAVETVEPGGGLQYEVPLGAGSCFGDGDAAFVVAVDQGEGTVVAVGGPGPFTNEALDDADHAVMAAALLAADPPTEVAFLEPSPPGSGDEGLLELVPVPVERALAQLAIAFLLYAWFRARRVGRPVLEPLPTELAGSELTAAVGQLLQQARDPAAAAEVLRRDLRRLLGRRLGVPPDAEPEVLADAAARRGGDRDRVLAALTRPVADDAELVVLGREIDDICVEVLHDERV
jgi:hypothetical protein